MSEPCLELDEWEEEYISGDNCGIMPEPEYVEDFTFLQRQRVQQLGAVTRLRPSQFTAFAMMMPHPKTGQLENFSFEGRRHIKRPYDSPARRILLFCARQVEKSTLLGNITLSYCCIIPNYKVLYVSPSAMQTKTFSADRLKEPIDTSDVLRGFTTGLLAKNIFEKQFVNRSKVTLRYSYLTADRCVVGSTRVHFADGTTARVQDVFENRTQYVGQDVWAVDPASQAVVSAKLTDAVDQGVRQVLDVRVQGGAQLRCTANQPLLTWEGWKPLDSLRVGDWVAVPRTLPHGVGLDAPVEEFRLVGYLLGDGSTIEINSVGLHNGTPCIMEDFQQCARALGIPLWKIQDCNKKHWVHSQTKTQKVGGGWEGYKGTRLAELGVLGADHKTKRVPTQFFQGNAGQIRAFLRSIFATDGWASVSKKGQFEIGYGSNSIGLLHDLKQLLLRFGIQAVVSRQKKPSTAKAQGAYVLSIRHSQHVLSYCDQIGIFGKEEAVARVRAEASRVTCVKNDFDRIPLTYAALRQRLRDVYDLSTHTAWTRYAIQLRPGNSRDSVGRRLLREIADKLQDDLLRSMADSSVGWARIESVLPVGEERTFDLTIERVENYLSDGIFVHNTRGIPAFALLIDEIQDILWDNIPIMEQCTSHAPDQFKKYIYAGTPKSLDNTIEKLRANQSTQGEWVVPCDNCGSTAGAGRYWNVLGEKNIGKKCLICEKCGKPLNPMHPDAQWASMVAYDPTKEMYEAYRIPQLMVPWKPWSELIHQYEHYPRAQFYNEVLGISFDSGTRPLTLTQVKDQCRADLSMDPDELEKYTSLSYSQPTFMGIDWGTGENTYTVITLATYIEGKFRVFYFHRCTGQETEPPIQLALIAELIHKFNPVIVGTDYGGGFDRNDALVRLIGPQRLQKYQYMARCKKKVDWDGKLIRWKISRTETMSDIFNAIKRGVFEFPRWEEMRDPYAADMCNIFSEYSETLKMIQYMHTHGMTDDSFHSLLYCFMGSMIKIPRPDVIVPRRELPNQGPLQQPGWFPVDQG